MKRKIAGLLAALMVLTLGTTTLAAPSVTAEDLKEAAAAVKEVTGVEGVQTEAVSAEVYTEAQTKAVATNEKAEMLAIVEVTVPAGTDLSKGVTLTFAVEGVKAGDNIVILHKAATGWETIKADKVEDGKVTATFTSLSPVAIVKLPAGVSKDTGVVTVLPIVAIACVAGIAGCVKKENE